MNHENNDANYGSGKFGQWDVDQFNLPVYKYTCWQTLDPLARYSTSGKDSINHWHQIGNDRITLTAHNGGYIQFFIADRGLQWLSFRNTQQNSLGGGICFIEENGKVWSDLYNSHMKSLQIPYQRIFGCGYFQKIIEKNNIVIDHFIYPPFGDDPIVLSEITIINKSNQVRTISIYEFWSIRI